MKWFKTSTVKTWLVATAERLERATRSHAAWPILSQRPGDRRQSLRRLGGRAEPRRLFGQQLVEAEAAAMAGSGRTMLGFPLLVPLRKSRRGTRDATGCAPPNQPGAGGERGSFGPRASGWIWLLAAGHATAPEEMAARDVLGRMFDRLWRVDSAARSVEGGCFVVRGR